MANFPPFPYDARDVRRAGEALATAVMWDINRSAEIGEIFSIANKWRDSHALPMRVLRYEMQGNMRRCKLNGVTAARLKRMLSIRKKLSKLHLDKVQDLGGCRAIVPSIKDLTELIVCQTQRSRHKLYSQRDYINSPKTDGYRCHHLMYEYVEADRDDQALNGRRIELQLRTRLQHSWATAVEAVGLFRGEDIKGGRGDPEWRRLFLLMSAELAMAEQQPEGEGTPSHKDRAREIIDLDKKLNATNTLDTLRNAFRYTDDYIENPHNRAEYFLIEYDHSAKTVRAEPYFKTVTGIESLDRIEQRPGINAVLVETDKIENLKDAYPNYFGDVSMFVRNLRDVVRGETAKEYVMPPIERIPPSPKAIPDLSWFKKRYRRWVEKP